MLGEGAGEMRGFFVTASGRNVKGEAEVVRGFTGAPRAHMGVETKGPRRGPRAKGNGKNCAKPTLGGSLPNRRLVPPLCEGRAFSSNSMATLPVGLGETFADKYRIDRVIGEGGMGVVVLAHHLELDQPVAIKFLHDSMTDSAEGAERFRREARAAARIQSDHVARVFDVGVLDNGTRFMVMEYLHGRDLAREIANMGALPVAYATRIMLETLEAIVEAHLAGIIHRDLKPANIFLTQRPDGRVRVKVLDFGISKSVGVSSVAELSLTKTSAWIGSPLYMAPEQMQSARDVDHRADIWSLGAIFYEILTGAPPFQAESLPQLCTMLMSSDAEPVSRKRVEIPPALEAIVMRCLSRDPSARYQSARAVLEDLHAFAATISGASAGAFSLAPLPSQRSVEPLSVDVVVSVPGQTQIPATKPSAAPLPSAERISTGTAVSWADAPKGSQAKGRSWTKPAALGAVFGLLAVIGGGVYALSSRSVSDASAEEALAPGAPASAPLADASAEALPPPEEPKSAPEPAPEKGEPAPEAAAASEASPASEEEKAEPKKTTTKRATRASVAASPSPSPAAPEPAPSPASTAPEEPKKAAPRAADDLSQFGGRR